MKLGKIWIFLTLYILICATSSLADDRKRLGPNQDLFRYIKKLWLKKNHEQLQALFDERVTIDLAIYRRGRFPRQQARGILQKYFSKVQIIKLQYVPKKMSISRGVAIYTYKVIATGVIKRKWLYFYLVPKETKWLLVSINEIYWQKD